MCRISIIVPCLNEKKVIVGFLDHLSHIAGEDEVIIVDGGSTDGTIEAVWSYPEVCMLETGNAQRGAQMNAGAMHASGEVLLFLHADTFLPENYNALISASMRAHGCVGGSFYLEFDHPHWLLHLTTHITKWNIPYLTVGDHAMFFRRTVFEKLGGYAEIPILEDMEFQLRARKVGKMVKVPAPVRTSARRFLNNGVVRQAFHDGWILLRYFMGVSPERLAAEYSNASADAR